MSNGYALEEGKKEYFKVLVKAFIMSKYNDVDLSNTGINFYTLGEVLKELGYEKESHDSNGWQVDLTIAYAKEGCEKLIVHGTAFIFEIKLSKQGYFEGEEERVGI